MDINWPSYNLNGKGKNNEITVAVQAERTLLRGNARRSWPHSKRAENVESLMKGIASLDLFHRQRCCRQHDNQRQFSPRATFLDICPEKAADG